MLSCLRLVNSLFEFVIEVSVEFAPLQLTSRDLLNKCVRDYVRLWMAVSRTVVLIELMLCACAYRCSYIISVIVIHAAPNPLFRP